ncbi:MAG: hypothetical protein ACI9F9_002640 [Candidatus Paceibacteria bacterium]
MTSTPGEGAPSRELTLARLGALILALALSSLPLVFGSALEESLVDASRLAMAWTPWIVVAGWPAAPGSRRDWPLMLGLALPITCLAAWFDLEAGLGVTRLQASFAGGALVSVALAEARARAAAGGVTSYAYLWFVLIAVVPALAVSLAWGGGAGGSGGNGWPSISPLLAIWRDVQPAEGDMARRGVESALFCPSTLVCLGLCAWAAGRGKRA